MNFKLNLANKYVLIGSLLALLLCADIVINDGHLFSTQKDPSAQTSLIENTKESILGSGGRSSTPPSVGLLDFKSQSLLPLLLKGFSSAKIGYDSIPPNSVLLIRFYQNISERGQENPFEELIEVPFFEEVSSMGLIELRTALQSAKKDERIQAVLLDLGSFSAGFASLEEIRTQLLEFKNSKKSIYAYSESMSEGAYYLASVADDIFLNPAGSLEFNGLVSEQVYFKNAMDRLDIRAEVFRAGSFKSAIEPFVRENMSEESRKQTAVLLNSIYDHYLAQIAKTRNLEIKELKTLANELTIQSPEDALKYNLITQIGYQDECITHIEKKMLKNASQQLSVVEYNKYRKNLPTDTTATSQNKIAVVVASGEILSGQGDQQNLIGSAQFVKMLRAIKEDTTFKAVVLRINSPGGSALASDVIWREIERTKAVKPVIASMSDVAASGGYYLAMACDEIVAYPNTITGSIGVFGLLLDMGEFLKEKLGITTDRVSTSEFADIGNPTRPLKEKEKVTIQNMVDSYYRTFTRKAAAGRKISIEALKEVAEGRVWAGIDARTHQLIDTLGGLDLALARAAEKAKITEYALVYFPEKDNFFKKILEGLNVKAQLIEETPLQQLWKEMPLFFDQRYWLYRLKNHDFLQMRLPYDIRIK